MEHETIWLKSEIKQEIEAGTKRLAEIENLLYYNRKQRPLFIPFIKNLEKEYSFIDINIKALKDRLDKLDGSF